MIDQVYVVISEDITSVLTKFTAGVVQVLQPDDVFPEIAVGESVRVRLFGEAVSDS